MTTTPPDPFVELLRKTSYDLGTFEGALANIIHMAEGPAPDLAGIAGYAREVLGHAGSKFLPPVPTGTGWPVT